MSSSKDLCYTTEKKKLQFHQGKLDMANKDNGEQKEYEDRVVTDSVHERFQQTHVRCDICNQDILGNEAAIRKHFNDSHPSDRNCCYCKGKVFIYQKIMTVDSRELSESFIYHKCKHNKQLEMNMSEKPM